MGWKASWTATIPVGLNVATVSLPVRAGVRPQTTGQTPHSQLDQQPPDRRLTDAIVDEARTWPHVVERRSRVSVEGARALTLDDEAGGAPDDAFMADREFCHAHAQGDYSFHAALPTALALEAERAGWAEPHFLVRTGQVPPTVVMIYAPRDEAERFVVMQLVRASYQFARSAPTDGQGSAG